MKYAINACLILMYPIILAIACVGIGGLLIYSIARFLIDCYNEIGFINNR